MLVSSSVESGRDDRSGRFYQDDADRSWNAAAVPTDRGRKNIPVACLRADPTMARLKYPEFIFFQAQKIRENENRLCGNYLIYACSKCRELARSGIAVRVPTGVARNLRTRARASEHANGRTGYAGGVSTHPYLLDQLINVMLKYGPLIGCRVHFRRPRFRRPERGPGSAAASANSGIRLGFEKYSGKYSSRIFIFLPQHRLDGLRRYGKASLRAAARICVHLIYD